MVRGSIQSSCFHSFSTWGPPQQKHHANRPRYSEIASPATNSISLIGVFLSASPNTIYMACFQRRSKAFFSWWNRMKRKKERMSFLPPSSHRQVVCLFVYVDVCVCMPVCSFVWTVQWIRSNFVLVNWCKISIFYSVDITVFTKAIRYCQKSCLSADLAQQINNKYRVLVP